MSELPPEPRAVRAFPSAWLATTVLALVAAMGGLLWSFLLQKRLVKAEMSLQAAQQRTTAAEQQRAASEERVRAMSDDLGRQLGLTHMELEQHADAILRRQVNETARLEQTQKQAERKIGAVSTDLSAVRSDVRGVKTDVKGVKTEVKGVRTEVGGVRTDVASARSELADTKAQLQRTMGDAGVMSGLIARNHDELLTLRRRGERSYYEFTLHKGDKLALFGGIRVQLKKLNEKHARYTMLVASGDREIEKKDKTLDEPVQFYGGKDRLLYEIVVNSIANNEISGYLSAPKGT